MNRRRGIVYLTGALVGIAPPFVWMLSAFPVEAEKLVSRAPLPEPRPETALAVHTELASHDPQALIDLGYARYQRDIREYRCVLVKQERLDDGLTAAQQIEVRYRESPHTVYMLWQKNADQAKRALYMDAPDFVDKKGRKLARVEPAGALVRLFVTDTFVQIHGPEARQSSRRSIDECGFAALFNLLHEYNGTAAARGVLNIRCTGTGQVDGRPTFVIVRDLPYEGPKGPYPDARLILHLDQEWLLPVAVYSYADRNETQLLGSYVFTKVELNPGFTEDAFRF